MMTRIPLESRFRARLGGLGLWGLAVLPVSAGCQRYPAPRSAGAAYLATHGFESVPVEEPKGMDEVRGRPFRVLPGDVLGLKTLSIAPIEVDRLVVDDAGRVTLPSGQDAAIGGLELAAAQRQVEEALRSIDRFGRAMLLVKDPAGHRATLVGAVAKPGVYPIAPGARVAELMAAAGGPKMIESEAEALDLADLDAARIVRDGKALPVSIGRALEGHPRHNVRLDPGDVVVVPPARARRVAVLGEVKQARAIAFRKGLRLSDALAMAGGLGRDADRGDVRVIRGPLSRPRIYQASVAAFVRGAAPDVALESGDVVYVTKHWFATATEVVQRLVPLLAAGTLAAALF